MKSSDKIAVFVVVAAIGLGFYANRGAVVPTPPPTPQPQPTVVTTDAAAVAAPLTGFSKQAKELSAFYRDFSKVLKENEAALLPSTLAKFKDSHSAALKVFAKSEAYSGAPSIGEKVDLYLAKAIGGNDGAEVDDQAFGPIKSKITSAMDELSAAFAQVK